MRVFGALFQGRIPKQIVATHLTVVVNEDFPVALPHERAFDLPNARYEARIARAPGGYPRVERTSSLSTVNTATVLQIPPYQYFKP